MKTDLEKLSNKLKYIIMIFPLILMFIISLIIFHVTIIEHIVGIFLIMIAIEILIITIVIMEDVSVKDIIYNFLKTHTSMKKYMNVGFEYFERQEKLSHPCMCKNMYIKTLYIDDQVIQLNDSLMTIRDLVKLIKSSNTFSMDCDLIELPHFEKYDATCVHFPLSQIELLSQLHGKRTNNCLRDCDWEVDETYQRKFIYVRNKLIPNECLVFMNTNNDSNLLTRIKSIDPKIMLFAMLQLNQGHQPDKFHPSIFNQYLDKTDYVYGDNTHFMDDKQWNIFQFSNTESIKEKIVDTVHEESYATQTIEMDILKNTPVGKLILEINDKLEKGYVFENISIDRYNDGYRKECMDILSSPYNMSQEQETKILTILQTLRDNMYNKKEKQHTLDTDVSIKAMEELLKYDGIINNLKM